jgi:hypothetical protein
MRRERRPWPAAEGNSSNLRTAIAELLRWTACAANGLLFPASLLLGLAGLLADGVPDEVGIWLLLGLPGSAVNVLAFLRRATPPTGWAVAAVLTGSCFLGVAGWCWVGSFNTWSGFSPPFETLAFGTAGVVTLMALLARWPVRIAAILPTVGSRLLAAGVAAAVAVTAVWYVAVRVERVSAQYPAARHSLRLGGAVRWTDFQETRTSHTSGTSPGCGRCT